MWLWDRTERRARGQARTFLAFLSDDPAHIAGIVAFDSISTGSDSTAILSFSIDGPLEGWGLAYEMTLTACLQIFDRLHLQTLVAYHHPANTRSAALLQRLGFRAKASLTEVPVELAGSVAPQVMTVLDAAELRRHALEERDRISF
jgi:RimJ/RimL family protein N-acetyltransferase